MRVIRVGEIFEDIPNSGVRLGLCSEALSLTLAIPHCSDKLVEEVKQGDFKLALTIKEGLMFFLFRLDSLGWCDAPFTIHNTNLNVQEFDSSCIQVFLVDSYSGILKAITSIFPSEEFQKRLKEEFNRQSNERFNRKEYREKLHFVYDRYSSEDLLEINIVKSGCSSLSFKSMICE